jgi:hypothetical protein
VKRWILPAAAMIVVIGLGILAVVILSSRSRRPDMQGETRYNPRELLVPQAQFLFPDVERELLHPGVLYTVDPDSPLDGEIIEAIEVDVLDALREDLLRRVESDVEALLFE